MSVIAMSTVANHATFLYAVVSVELMVVYRSLLVHDNSELFKPIKKILSSRNHRLISSETHDDESMMFGKACLSVYSFRE